MLTVEKLFVKFKDRIVLEGVDLNVKPGEIIGLIGQNGSGKTTLLNALSGFVRSEGGSILFKEEDVTLWSPHRRAQMGIGRSFQNAGVFKEMTLKENLMIALEHAVPYPWWWQFSKKYRGLVDKQIASALESVGLEGHKDSLAGVLSGGQLRLLELLRLKISGGDLLLIDEPTAGVSPSMKRVLSQSIKDLAAEKSRSIVLVEHDIKFLFGLVDRVIVLAEGRVYMQGTPEQVVADKRLQELYFGS